MGVFNSVWHKVSGRERDWRAVKVSHWVGGLWVSGVGIGFALSREAPGLGWGNWSCSSSWEAWGSSLSSIPPLLPPPNTHTGHLPSLPPPPAPVSQQAAGVRFSFCSAPRGKKANTRDCRDPTSRLCGPFIPLFSAHTVQPSHLYSSPSLPPPAPFRFL